MLRSGLHGVADETRLVDLRSIDGEEVMIGDIKDLAFARSAIAGCDACVHLAAIPVEAPFDQILHSNIQGAWAVFEAARLEGCERIVFASSNHATGFYPITSHVKASDPVRPDTYYGVSKVFSYWITRNYREAYGMYAVNGILFNHESPRRGPTFVTRKVTRAIGAILRGEQNELRLGNLEAKRDWGYARDYMEGAWQMLQADEPDDYVVATGETHTVQKLVETAFGCVDLDWKKYVTTDPALVRPAEVDLLIGDPAKAKKQLGWKPEQIRGRSILAPDAVQVLVMSTSLVSGRNRKPITRLMTATPIGYHRPE